MRCSRASTIDRGNEPDRSKNTSLLDAGRPPRQLIEESLDLAGLRAFWSLVLEVIETRDR
jgi:hypothetical protein